MIYEITLLDISLLISCIIFAIIGYYKKIIDKKVLVLILLFAAYFIILFPIYWFIPLFLLYIFTSIATQYKRKTKKLPEKKGRRLKNILSNLLPSFICSFIFIFFIFFQKDDSILASSIFVAYLSGIACANADTMSSELGQIGKEKPILITTFKKVEIGADGGITLFGLLVAAIGSILVSLPALLVGNMYIFLIASVTGFIGCNIDSFIGAAIESKGKCTNETTNLIATTSSTIIGFIIYIILFV